MSEKQSKKPIFPFGSQRGAFTASAMCEADGIYHLFFARKSFPCGISSLGRAVSFDLLHWETRSDIKTFPRLSLSTIEASSVTVRNKKYVLLVKQKTLAGTTLQQWTTSNFLSYEKYPLPVLTGRNLGKPLCGFASPRVTVSDGKYYLLTAAGNGIDVLSSPNLIDWEPKGRICAGDKAVDFPSLVGVDGRHLLFETVKLDGARAFGYRYGAAELGKGKFEDLSGFIKLDYLDSPRLTKLADGRVILIGGIRTEDGRGSMATPRELYYDGEGLRQLPVKETLKQRTSVKTATLELVGGINREAAGINGKRKELEIKADLREGQSFTAVVYQTGCRGARVTYDKYAGALVLDISTLIKKKAKKYIYEYPVKQSDFMEMRILLSDGRIECYADGGRTVFSKAVNCDDCGSQISFEANGKAKIQIKGYDLED